MKLTSVIAALLIALSVSIPVCADTGSSRSPYLETDREGRSVMP